MARSIPIAAPGTLPTRSAGLDENVAAELERSAGRARARGGLAAGAAFPRACRRTHPRSEAPGTACAPRREEQAPGRSERRGAAVACDRTGGAAGRDGAGSRPAVVRTGHLRDDPGTRCSTPAARGGQAARAAGSDARARDLPRRVRGGVFRRPPGARRRCPRGRGGRSGRRLGARYACLRSAARRACLAYPRGLCRGGASVEGRAARGPGGAAVGGGRAALALAGGPHRARTG